MRKNRDSLEGRVAAAALCTIRWDTLQRLYSNFANGLPGKGLFVLRLAVSAFMLHASANALLGGKAEAPMAVLLTAAAFGGLFLLAGLWTPAGGAIVAVIELWIASIGPADWPAFALAASIAAALAFLGPGSWSVDARIYGRKRISIQGR